MEVENLGNIPYENLIIGIIRQAAMDYRDAVWKLRKDKNNEKAQVMKRQCEKFLRNDLEMYEPLVSVSGDYILRELNLQLGKETTRKKYKTCIA